MPEKRWVVPYQKHISAGGGVAAAIVHYLGQPLMTANKYFESWCLWLQTNDMNPGISNSCVELRT